MTYYIQVNLNNIVQGYSSTRMNETDIEIEESLLSKQFLALPFFHKYIKESNSFIFDEELKKQFKKEKENRLTNEQKLGQKCSDLEIQMLMIQQMLMLQNKSTTESANV